MKKTLRMMGLCALAALALAGCKKDEQTTSSFKATLPQPTSDAKTHIGNGDSLLWNAGDAIKVFDTDGNAYLFTTDDDNKSTATFTGETSLNASNTYTAFYPAANTSDVTNGEILLTLAADQTYVAGGFANGTYPVVAQNEGASFTFDSDCGLLAIPVMGTGNISTIELTGKASENLAGQLRYDLSGHYLGLTNAQTTVTLDCGNLPLSADATTFYFVVPAGVFANGFTAVLKNGTTELFTLATTNPNTIVAAHIMQMPVVEVSSITMTTGSTPANVGYTDATVFGSYVAPTGMGVTEIGFYFGTDASAMTATPVTPIASPFSHTFDGLTAGTTYYYQAYVKNGTNEYLGTVESFTTNVPAATVTTAPTAKTGVTAGQNEAIVNAGVAEGGTMMYMVTTENTKPTSTTGFSATVPTAETLASGTYYVWYYVQGDATHTDSGISDTAITVTVTGGGDEHAYVDLGLPSGLLWATCNIGANAPEEYGDYFAWGETTTKTTYNWSTYQYCMGSNNTLTKYCNKANYGYNGFTDDLTTLLPGDDVATANWGSDWRMPTKAEFQELLDYTNMTWTQQGGVNGWLFTATDDSGNSLFLPAAGDRCDGGLNEAGEYGYYWSSSRDSYYPYYACYFLFGLYYGSDYCDIGSYDRGEGRTVRPVREN